jgi:aryl-alcohol dehydrogenase-like predicted oxidoreductase
MTFGTPVGYEQAEALVSWALDHGINFIDTADIYEGYARTPGSAGGVAEDFLGRALVGKRDRAVITTKVGNAVGSAASDRGLSPGHIARQVEQSLRRLRTDHVEFYLMHRADPDTPIEESIAVMAKLIDQGKIRHWGFSNFAAPEIRATLEVCDGRGLPRPVVSQPPYSWLKRDVEADELPLCQQEGISMTPYQPLQGGLLSGKYRRGMSLPDDSRAAENRAWMPVMEDALFDQLEAFECEANRAGMPPAQYAVHWVASRPCVASVVVGVKSVSQLQALLTRGP